MIDIALRTRAAAALIVGLMPFGPTPAQAQSLSTTWVSRSGSDENNCFHATPCRTLQEAHDKSSANAEIRCLDAGTFGAITITKSVTIDCSSVENGQALGGTEGITINTAGIDVLVRGLDFNGNGNSGEGIWFRAGHSLTVEGCLLHNQFYNGTGIRFAPTLAAQLTVIDSLIRRNGTTTNGVNGGIVIKPTASGYASVQIINSKIVGNGTAAVLVDTTAATGSSTNVSIEGSSLSNSRYGVFVSAPVSNARATVTVSRSTVTGNIVAGLYTTGGGAVIRITDSIISGNTAGVENAGGTLVSYGNNVVAGNGTNGTFSGVAPLM